MIKGNHTDAGKSYYQPPFVLHSRDQTTNTHPLRFLWVWKWENVRVKLKRMSEWLEYILFKMNVIFLFHKVLCCFVMLNPYKGRHVWIPETCFYFLKFVILLCKPNLIQLSLFSLFLWRFQSVLPTRLMDDS